MSQGHLESVLYNGLKRGLLSMRASTSVEFSTVIRLDLNKAQIEAIGLQMLDENDSESSGFDGVVLLGIADKSGPCFDVSGSKFIFGKIFP